MSGVCYQFRDQGFCKFGDSCRFAHGDAGGNSGNNNSSFGGGGFSQNYNSYGGGGGGYSSGGGYGSRGVCYEFRDTGACKFGDTCRFSHGDAQGGQQPQQGYGNNDAFRNFGRRQGGFGGGRGVCYEFRDYGSCRFGDQCRFSHDASGASGAPAPSGDMKSNSDNWRSSGPIGGSGFGGGSKVCFNFQNSGFCKFGDTCKFSHSVSGNQDASAQDNTMTDDAPSDAAAPASGNDAAAAPLNDAPLADDQAPQ